ncbi:hypothetical protein AMEX_G25167 [Astyanax mexicanus]|uniref:Immunoglobulin subtype domain-containing protein n=1 Tax=Astyanax mexicanus TaxID=7994 RepID=A0A8T2KXV4_ASTMX|nr:hypothetical protein AMEX_G25167 [Astyanax mexicanus]
MRGTIGQRGKIGDGEAKRADEKKRKERRSFTMLSCKCDLSVLLLMTVTLSTGSESAHPVVEVEYGGAAVLPCTERCSGVVSWTRFSKSSDILAECDQTSCRSVKEGYQMIHNQYLQGDFSLIITEADFSKREHYTADCDGKDKCDVQLQIEPVKKTFEKRPGESLQLNLHISDPVEVIYSSTDPAGPSSHQICTVNRRSVQLSREYSERASVSSALELRGVKESDSGVYTVRDTSTNEVICIYTVIVQGDSKAGGHEQKPSDPNSSPSPGWVVPMLVVVLGVVCVVSVGVIVVQWRKIKHLKESQNIDIPLTEMDKNRSPEEEKNLVQQNGEIQNLL